MILRSPTENENGGLSFHMVPSSTRHSRARGNPGLLRRISLDTRFRGYDGTQAGLLVLIPKRVFSKEITKATKVSHIDISKLLNFVLFVTFVVKSIFFFRSRRQRVRRSSRNRSTSPSRRSFRRTLPRILCNGLRRQRKTLRIRDSRGG